MGIWGSGLFENDAACDVQDIFTSLIPAGCSVETVVAQVADRHLSGRAYPAGEAEWIAEEADAETVLALAWMVLDYRKRQPGGGPLIRAVLARAARVVASGEELEEWTGPLARDRRRVYRELSQRLACEINNTSILS